MKAALIGCTILGGLAIVSAPLERIRKDGETDQSYAGLEAHESQAGATLLGQFRTNISSWLWLKTDLYLHNGVEMRPQTQAEIDAGEQAVKDGDGWHEAIGDKERLVTSIPGANHDFRGVFGDIDREINAYTNMEGHVHNSTETALPLFRLMTWIDPHFSAGWTTGAMAIFGSHRPDSVDRAIDFLREGWQANPRSIAIRGDLARLLALRKGETDEAIRILESATNDAWDRRLELSEEERDGAIDCYRWLALLLADRGRIEASKQVASAGLKVALDDPVLERLSHPIPALLVPEKGKAATPADNPAAALKADAEAGDDHHDHEGHHDHAD